MKEKSMTLRLSEGKAKELEKLAAIDGVPISEAVRKAIDEHIERRKKDAAFQARRKKILKEDKEIFERLAG